MKTETTIPANPKIQQSEKSQFRQYASYKPSNVEWLGDVPSHWKVERIKDVVQLRIEKTSKKSEQKDYLELEDIEQNTGKIIRFRNTTEVSSDVTIFKKGDVLFGKLRPYLAKYWLATIDGKCTGEIIAMNCMKVHNIFFKYFIGSQLFIEQCTTVSYGAKMPRVDWTRQIAYFYIAIPSRTEQTAIAAYLDQATANIDKVIATKQKQLEKLEQYKQSKIHECVTGKHRLNLDLQDEKIKGLKSKNPGIQNISIQTKDSGIDWIGDVPRHWKVEKIKRRMSFVYGSALKEEDRVDGQFNVYGSNGVVGTHNYSLTDGETIIIGRKGTAGALNYCYEPCYPIDTAYFIDKTATEANIRFLYYALQTLDLDKMNEDSAVPGLSRENAYQKQLAFPPRVEQKELAEYLDEFCDKISKEKTIIEQQIEKLKQYRKCLIHECVTGKRKVINE